MGVQETRLAINATLQDLQERYTKNPPEKQQLQVLYDKFYNDLIDLNAGALDDAAGEVEKAANQLSSVLATASTSPFDVYLKGLQQIANKIGVLLPGPPTAPAGRPLGTTLPPRPATSTQPNPASAGAASPAGDVAVANRDTNLLHPMMRERAQKVLAACAQQNLPFRIFEAWRSPERQRYLFEQGRSRPGSIITYAQAWQSYHQYGLAVDFVLYPSGGSWSWDDAGPKKALWDNLHEIGKSVGLEPLGFETPHLQVAGLKIGELGSGKIPDGGDETWQANFRAAADRWTGSPPAPTQLPDAQARPAIASGGINWSACPVVGTSDWHAQFGGQQWRFDQNGVYLRDAADPLRSPGAPTTIQSILATYGSAIQKASVAYGVPPELIVMTIAVETAAYRNVDFTGPRTFRWEPAVRVTDVTPPSYGDYSAGPMQTLASTARETIKLLNLSYDPFGTAPSYAQEPVPPPVSLPLYDGATNIDLGTAEIKKRIGTSGLDPVLVAACFNAGGLYQSDRNAWCLRSQNDHLDRAVQWFGDACFVLSSLRNLS